MHAAWADLAEMPDIGQAIICMGGGDGRAGGHGIDATTGGDGSGVQDTATPACVPFTACLLLLHCARLRPPNIALFACMPFSENLFSLSKTAPTTLHECSAHVPTASAISFALLAWVSLLV